MACSNRIKCTCTYTSCSRHGKCCECVAYHRRSGEVPGCFFSASGERTYDRSIENLYRDYKKNG
ncbi:MAG TPA: DUF6485 family protein [Clostridia bacterium]|jgi:hypothetical protein|nr:hypothetical protein [Clostridiaceae bacterium]HOA30395.1 DUF6485 family protein [Clostridia bacterium]HPZ52196.1 DUF6485 family protein [Clostridia bacterium]